MPRVYMYVVDRDFGFAPNPFHGVCTLATCKPIIRRTAQVGDWIIGMGGRRLNATGNCIFAMQVDECVTFDAYWNDPRFRDKRPIRNGSKKMMVGDNIYHRVSPAAQWQQEDSHHSLPDGSPNIHNLEQDTQTNRVLISRKFLFFGSDAPSVPVDILSGLGYQNGRSHRVFDLAECSPLLDWMKGGFGSDFGCVLADPFDFSISTMRYSVSDNRVT